MAEDKNLFVDNIFSVKVKSKEGFKEIELRPYSFSIQLKLMESGLLNELVDLSKSVNADKELDTNKIDFKKFGGLLRVAINVMHEMLPTESRLVNNLEKFTDNIADGEPMRFVNWIMEQFKKSNDFLVQPPQKGGELNSGRKRSAAK